MKTLATFLVLIMMILFSSISYAIDGDLAARAIAFGRSEFLRKQEEAKYRVADDVEENIYIMSPNEFAEYKRAKTSLLVLKTLYIWKLMALSEDTVNEGKIREQLINLVLGDAVHAKPEAQRYIRQLITDMYLVPGKNSYTEMAKVIRENNPHQVNLSNDLVFFKILQVYAILRQLPVKIDSWDLVVAKAWITQDKIDLISNDYGIFHIEVSQGRTGLFVKTDEDSLRGISMQLENLNRLLRSIPSQRKRQ